MWMSKPWAMAYASNVRVELHLARSDVAPDRGHVVVGHAPRHRSEQREGLLVQREQRRKLLVQGEAHHHEAREGQHQ
jgi:hypothetical protein